MKKFITKLTRDDILDLSAALSYYTALALAPLLILLVTFLSTLGPHFQEQLIREVDNLVGGQAADAIQMIIESAKNKPNLRSWAGLFGVLTLLFSAGAIFGQLRDSLNRIFEVPAPEEPENPQWWTVVWQFLREKIFNMGVVLSFVFISIVSLVISSGISVYLEGTEQIVGQIINFAGSILVFTLLFGGIFMYLPSRRIHLRVGIMSGLLTAFFFSLGKSLIGLYLGKSAVASAYGAAGSMIILLVWVYYSSAIIFVCAELAFHMEENRNRRKALRPPTNPT